MKEMNPHSKIWIYQSNREFTTQEAEDFKLYAADFIKSWNSHGTILQSSIELRYNRFIIIAVDESVTPASGCSIDKSVAFIKSVEQKFHLNLFDRMQVAYRKSNGNICTAHLLEFEKMIAAGDINEETTVFNNLVEKFNQLQTQWEVPVKMSWHSKLLA
jgi:hypothetical protein